MRNCRNPLSLDMGWKPIMLLQKPTFRGVAIRFRWIWVGSGENLNEVFQHLRRNPLSLDMGWKKINSLPERKKQTVAIRFRWIWVGRVKENNFKTKNLNVAIRFRWIWVGSVKK